MINCVYFSHTILLLTKLPTFAVWALAWTERLSFVVCGKFFCFNIRVIHNNNWNILEHIGTIFFIGVLKFHLVGVGIVVHFFHRLLLYVINPTVSLSSRLTGSGSTQ